MIDYQGLEAELKAQFLPEGEVELCACSDKKFSRYANLGFGLTGSNLVLTETFERSFVVTRVNEDMILSVSVNRGTHNIGIMKNLSVRMKTQILEKMK